MKHKLLVIAQPGWPPFNETVFRCEHCLKVIVIDERTRRYWNAGVNIWSFRYLGPRNHDALKKWIVCRGTR